MGLSKSQKLQKRTLDLIISTLGIVLTFPIILLAWIVATLETKENGFFIQKRVGENGKRINVIKIKTMRSGSDKKGSITVKGDNRITKSGNFFRKTKIDELPQLFNVLIGDMSLVGPRPDVEGYADNLKGEDRVILSIKPGITGPATLKYRDEESILSNVENPKEYNDKVIWPDKVRINKEYIKNWSISQDIKYIWETIVGK
jgi:lipopolysaccharide/colanic/teichoic acid biosynthesis glycosyltransferase